MVSELAILIIGAAGLSAGCLVPNHWLPASMPNDKLMHFLAFGGLALLALRIANGAVETSLWMLGLALSGWLIECLQQLLPDRGFSWRDIAANLAGIVCALLGTLAYQALA